MLAVGDKTSKIKLTLSKGQLVLSGNYKLGVINDKFDVEYDQSTMVLNIMLGRACKLLPEVTQFALTATALALYGGNNFICLVAGS